MGAKFIFGYRYYHYANKNLFCSHSRARTKTLNFEDDFQAESATVILFILYIK